MVVKNTNTQQAGFSLIEVLTTVSILGILSVISVNLFISTTRGTAKNTGSRAIKQTGEHILSLLENSIRNASELTANNDQPSVVCQDNMDSLALVSADGETTDIWQVTSGSITLNGDDVTGDNVTVENDRLNFDCTQDSATGVTYITVNFTLTRGSSVEDSDYVSEEFQTSVSLRNR